MIFQNGTYIVEDETDDLATAFVAAELDAADCYAMITEGEEGYLVEFLGNVDGEAICSSEEGMFGTVEAAKNWARTWVKQVDVNV